MLYSVLVSAEKSYVELPVALEGVVTLAEYQARHNQSCFACAHALALRACFWRRCGRHAASRVPSLAAGC